jgi:uncharacterized protein involved in exopolysaccharide biosynthesis/Mrp family chromosome partitioning ATPase
LDDFSRQPAPIRLRDLARVLRRRALIAVFTFAAVVVVANVLTARMKPVYEASTRLLIENSSGGGAPTSVLDLLRGGGESSNMDVEMEKIRSRAFMQRVIDRAKLPKDTNPDELMGRVVLNSGAGGQIFTVGARARTAEEARNLSLAVSEQYIAEARREFDAKSELGEERLSRARDEAYKEKVKAEAVLNEFTARMGLSRPEVFYESQARKTVEVKNSLTEARKNLPLQEKGLVNLRQALSRISPTIITGSALNKNVIIDDYRNQLITLQTERREKLTDYAEDSLEVQEIDAKIAYRKQALADIAKNNDIYSVGSKATARNPDHTKVQSAVYDAELGLKTTRQMIAALEKQLVGLEAEQRAMALQQSTYESLRRAREGANEAYERARLGLLGMKQSRVTSAPYIRVLDAARLPGSPLSPRPLFNNVLAAALGLLLGVGMALLAEIMAGGTLTDEMSVLLPRVGGVPLLGSLPTALPAPLTVDDRGSDLPVPLHAATAPNGSAVEDALREIGYVLAHRDGRGPAPVVLLSATRSDDTTAVLAAHLTATLVREGLRVTLVDADRQQPRLNRVFGAPDAPGLADAVARRRSVDDILHVGAEGRLRFLAAGAPDDKAPLTEGALRAVFGRLANPARTDIVVVSGPSVWSARHIVPLERASSGMVLVAGEDEQGTSLEDSVARARRILSNGRMPRMLGVVIGRGTVGALTHGPAVAAVAAPAGPRQEESV